MSREQPALAARGLRASQEAEGLPPSQERGPSLLLFLQYLFLASLTLKTQRVGILGRDMCLSKFQNGSYKSSTSPAGWKELSEESSGRSPAGTHDDQLHMRGTDRQQDLGFWSWKDP